MTSTVLVTGATGAIGTPLVGSLLHEGWHVRVLARHPDRIDAHWRDRVDVVVGDISDPTVVDEALTGCQVAYYLVHSMSEGPDFVSRDRELATSFAQRAKAAEVERIVYLSGLHPRGRLSPHLGSRVEVGEILLHSGVPTAVLQAGVVLGAQSASFEMLRYLTERLPVMVGPKWLRNRIQPIALNDVIHYLTAAASLPREVNRTIDIAMPEVMTYTEMMQRYATVAGLRRRIVVTLPVLTPWLASHWVGLVTPVDPDVAKPLVGSLIHEALAHENDADTLLGAPPGGILGFDDAVRRALNETHSSKKDKR